MSLGDAINNVTNLAFKPTEAAASVLGKADDLLARDESIPLSTILMRAGWGPKNSTLNKQARAVVKRESGGDPKKPNAQGSGAWGLFQILTPTHCGTKGIPRAIPSCRAYLENPLNNARVAKALYNAAGWQPWAASGGVPAPTDWDPIVTKKKDSLVGGTASDIGGTVSDAAGAVVSPFTSVAKAATEFIGTLLSADTWLRIGKGSLGFGLVIIGTGALVYVAANTASGGQVGRVAKKAAVATVLK